MLGADLVTPADLDTDRFGAFTGEVARRGSAAQAARAAGCNDMELAVPDDAPDMAGFCEATGFARAGLRFTRSLRRRS
jgi:hypothetical protein